MAEATAERQRQRAAQSWRGRDSRGRGTWRRGPLLALLAVLLACVLVFHRQIPDGLGNLGSLTETFLPWFGLGVPVLLVLGLLRKSAVAVAALALPVAVWFALFGALLGDKGGGAWDFTAVQHNVSADNTDVSGTMDTLLAARPDVISLEELTAANLPEVRTKLDPAYPYHVVEGTVGLWSRWKLTGSEAVDIRIGWTRALRTVVHAPKGDVAVFVAHLPSVRVKFDGGFTANRRNASAEALGEALAAERTSRVLLLGDLNGTMNDRALAPITSQMRSAQGSAGAGFGFSWPAAMPMARIDQIMSRGITPTDAWTLPRTGSDHLPIAAHFAL
jgi:vancomycin resistance protein VanJ